MENELAVRLRALEEKSARMELDTYEYLQSHSVTEHTQEIADRFIKRIVVHDEYNIEVEWNFPGKLSEELIQYQLAIT